MLNRLGQSLIECGYVGKDQLTIALQEHKKSGVRLGQVLVKLGFISENQLRQTLSKIRRVKAVDLGQIKPDPTALELIPREISARLGVIPVKFDKTKSVLIIAMSDTDDLVVVDQIRRLLPHNTQLRVVLALESDLEIALDVFYGNDQSIEQILEQLQTGDANDNLFDAPFTIVRLVNHILTDAVLHDCSDVHLEPEPGFIRIRYRMDGVMTSVHSLHKRYWNALVGRIKILADLDIAEHRRPQDGGFSLSLSGKQVDFRVSSFPVLSGENLVLRILNRSKNVLALHSLQQHEETVQLLQRVLYQPEGMVLVTGPTGSGKTSTLYSMVNELNTDSVNIMTLEDPVEYPLEMVRQCSIGQQQSMTYMEGVRAVLRQDPDIVLIGEIRDTDTARIALRAAMTGHKVLSTIHTRSAILAVQRLLDLGVDASMLMSNLTAVIAQRLIRLKCKQCSSARSVERECCKYCYGTGYKGRIAVMEILKMNDGLARLFIDNVDIQQIKDAASCNGWTPMHESAWRLQKNNLTDAKEIRRVFGEFVGGI